jgi:8-oxo-dGTP diphosphatase
MVVLVASRRYPTFPIPGVGAVVIGVPGFLLVRRDKDPAKGLWSVPGGAVEVGETQHQAVEREVYEETGVRCRVIRLLSTADLILPDSDGKVEFHFLLNHYLVEALTYETRRETPEAEVGWFSPESLPLDEMPEPIRDLLLSVDFIAELPPKD